MAVKSVKLNTNEYYTIREWDGSEHVVFVPYPGTTTVTHKTMMMIEYVDDGKKMKVPFGHIHQNIVHRHGSFLISDVARVCPHGSLV